jgi:CRISPR-associated protein Csa3
LRKLFIATLGFDEKFIIRSLIRNGLSIGDSIIIFAPKGYLQDDKSAKAAEAIKEIVAKILPNIELRIEEYNLRENLAEEICRVRDIILSYEFDEIISCLSGGMRALILGVFSTLLTLNNYRIIIEVEFESLEHYIRIPLNILKTPYSNRWLTILDYLSSGKSIRAISKSTGLSPATVSRAINDMRHYKLVDEKNQVTEDGYFYMKMYKRMSQKIETNI